jgi:hypothetical protein
VHKGYDYSSVQLPLPEDLSREMQRWVADNVDPADIFHGTKDDPLGIETHPHITVKYGLKDAEPSDGMRTAIKSLLPFKLKMGKLSLFENDDFDVLKIDIASIPKSDLIGANKHLEDLFDHVRTHDTYSPHATLVYLKKGTGKKYSGDSTFSGRELEVTSAEFSGKNGHKEMLNYEIRKVAYENGTWYFYDKNDKLILKHDIKKPAVLNYIRDKVRE